MLARPLHPRTPPRPDPQVPGDRNLGLLSSQDPAFGFCDIEVSIHHGARGKVRFELYCVADGYQTARGVGATHPLRRGLMARGKTLTSTDWHFPRLFADMRTR